MKQIMSHLSIPAHAKKEKILVVDGEVAELGRQLQEEERMMFSFCYRSKNKNGNGGISSIFTSLSFTLGYLSLHNSPG